MTEEELAAKNPDPCLWPKCPVAEDGIDQMRRRKSAETEVARLKQRNHLETAVVEAALVWNEADRAYCVNQIKCPLDPHPGFDLDGAADTLAQCVGALIAFRKEKGEVDA